MIGGYRLRNLIATGQTSQVLEVVEPASGRHFAMKALLPEASKISENRRMLFHEAEVGIKLAHQNIIKIVKVNKDPKQAFFVMEFFPAGSMKLRILQRNMEFIQQHALNVFKQAGTAFAYMHGNGWLHRDIKPDNILVNSVGEAKLIDFALAKRIKKASFFDKLFAGKQKPQGTPSYMSPEQIRCEDLDPRADIYSFGATIYEIITLRAPYRGANVQELLNKHLSEKLIAPQVHNPDITEGFNNLVMKLLSKKKEDRPNNFHEILIQLKKMRVFRS